MGDSCGELKIHAAAIAVIFVACLWVELGRGAPYPFARDLFALPSIDGRVEDEEFSMIRDSEASATTGSYIFPGVLELCLAFERGEILSLRWTDGWMDAIHQRVYLRRIGLNDTISCVDDDMCASIGARRGFCLLVDCDLITIPSCLPYLHGGVVRFTPVVSAGFPFPGCDTMPVPVDLMYWSWVGLQL